MERFDQRIDALQERQFHDLLQTASHTVWGQHYDFAHIQDYQTFSQRVPLQTYDDLRPYIHRMISGYSLAGRDPLVCQEQRHDQR